MIVGGDGDALDGDTENGEDEGEADGDGSVPVEGEYCPLVGIGQ